MIGATAQGGEDAIFLVGESNGSHLRRDMGGDRGVVASESGVSFAGGPSPDYCVIDLVL